MRGIRSLILFRLLVARTEVCRPWDATLQKSGGAILMEHNPSEQQWSTAGTTVVVLVSSCVQVFQFFPAAQVAWRSGGIPEGRCLCRLQSSYVRRAAAELQSLLQWISAVLTPRQAAVTRLIRYDQVLRGLKAMIYQVCSRYVFFCFLYLKLTLQYYTIILIIHNMQHLFIYVCVTFVCLCRWLVIGSIGAKNGCNMWCWLRPEEVLMQPEWLKDAGSWWYGMVMVWALWAFHSQRIHVWNIYLDWDYFKLL